MGIGGRAGKFYTGASFKYFFNSTNSTGMQLEAAYANITVGGYNLKGFIIKQIPFMVQEFLQVIFLLNLRVIIKRLMAMLFIIQRM